MVILHFRLSGDVVFVVLYNLSSKLLRFPVAHSFKAS